MRRSYSEKNHAFFIRKVETFHNISIRNIILNVKLYMKYAAYYIFKILFSRMCVIYNLRYVIIIDVIIISNNNLLKIYVLLGGGKIFVQISAGVLLLDLSSNRFLHFKEQFESFPAYVADYSGEKPISS